MDKVQDTNMQIMVAYKKGNKSSVIIGKIDNPPNPNAERVWGERIGFLVKHHGKEYIHLDESFKVEERIDGVLQPIQYEPKPRDINTAYIHRMEFI